MISKNHMQITFPGRPENESFARVVISAFAVQLCPTVSEIADIKTAVSEAVTNAIVHGYEGCEGLVTMRAAMCENGEIEIEIIDHGRGIANLQEAMEPFFTSKPDEERSGMGFAVMQTFMDSVEVFSTEGEGTTVRLKKAIAALTRK
jgi:anti-sigma F factor